MPTKGTNLNLKIMLSLNNITVQLSFQQTLEKFIFSSQTESTEKMAKYLAGKNII